MNYPLWMIQLWCDTSASRSRRLRGRTQHRRDVARLAVLAVLGGGALWLLTASIVPLGG